MLLTGRKLVVFRDEVPENEPSEQKTRQTPKDRSAVTKQTHKRTPETTARI